MAFYLAALGYTLDRDGWRFEPVPGRDLPRCAAAARSTPASARARLRGLRRRGRRRARAHAVRRPPRAPSTGCKAFHAGAWACASCPTGRSTRGRLASSRRRERDAGARRRGRVDGFAFDYRVAARLRVGPARRRPSAELYAPLRRHAPRRAPARAAVPLHVARHARRRRRSAACRPARRVEVEYDVPADAWYFDENGARVDAVRRAAGGGAAALRLARLATSAARSRRETDLVFRNLDGTGTRASRGPARRRHARDHDEAHVALDGGRHDHRRASRSRARRRRAVVYELKTVVRVLPGRGAFETRSGLPDQRRRARARFARAERRPSISRRRPRALLRRRRCACRRPMLLMLDRVTGFWPEGGAAGLGCVRAREGRRRRRVVLQGALLPGSGAARLARHRGDVPAAPAAACSSAGMGSGLAAPRFEPHRHRRAR